MVEGIFASRVLFDLHIPTTLKEKFYMTTIRPAIPMEQNISELGNNASKK